MKIFGLQIGKSEQTINPSKYTRSNAWLMDVKMGFNADTVNNEKAIDNGYRGNHDLYSIIDRIVTNTIDLPFDLIVKGEPILEGDIYQKFWKQHNSMQSFKQFWQQALTYYLATGDCYIWKRQESIGFNDISYHVLPTQLVVPENVINRSIFERPDYYDFYDGQTIRRLFPDEIIHIKKFDPGTIAAQTHEGMSPLQAGRLLLESANNLNTAEAAIFHNGGVSKIISGVMGTHSAGLTADDQDRLDKGFLKRVRGAWNFAKSIIIQSEARVLDIGLKPSELQIFDAQLTHLRKLCNLYGVSSALFNDPANKTYSNMREAERALFLDVILPLGEFIIEAFYENEYNASHGIDKVKINYDQVMQIHPEQMELRKQMLLEVNAGLISVDEFRTTFGQSELGGEFSLPKNNQTSINNLQNNQNE